MRQLQHIEVRRLLGQFDHLITFPSSWEFLILHGPNGIGKTKLLELLAATFRTELGRVSRIPFETAAFSFTDETKLFIARRSVEEVPARGMEPIKHDQLEISLSRGKRKPIVSRIDPASSRERTRYLRMVTRHFPVRQIAADVWRDLQTRETFSSSELDLRYGLNMPRSILEDAELDPAITEFLGELSVHLIETQRLLQLPPARQEGSEAAERFQPTVARYAEDLTNRLREALAENSRTSQELDRTFPRRIFEAAPPQATDEAIRERYAQQMQLRARLADIAVLDVSADVPLPDRPLEDWEQKVLWTYLDDADRKLTTFQTLLDRVRLLRKIVNDHFLYKEMSIDRERGFRFRIRGEREIDARLLSSGEQHELVLCYDLLLNVPEGSLVLIDEPEISLHVRWQNAFLEDLQEIAQLASLRFIIATHSPQIIHKWWGRAVPLSSGDAEDEF
jgi:ABC-type lipoprotein export system ATPase subunit